MLKIAKNQNTTTKTTPQTTTTTTEKLNASVALTDEIKTALEGAAEQLRAICGNLGGFIESQVEDPTYVEGKGVAADRLLDWTADLFAIAEDIDFYINPEPEK